MQHLTKNNLAILIHNGATIRYTATLLGECSLKRIWRRIKGFKEIRVELWDLRFKSPEDAERGSETVFPKQ